jgi:hypothetical protein
VGAVRGLHPQLCSSHPSGAGHRTPCRPVWSLCQRSVGSAPQARRAETSIAVGQRVLCASGGRRAAHGRSPIVSVAPNGARRGRRPQSVRLGIDKHPVLSGAGDAVRPACRDGDARLAPRGCWAMVVASALSPPPRARRTSSLVPPSVRDGHHGIWGDSDRDGQPWAPKATQAADTQDSAR